METFPVISNKFTNYIHIRKNRINEPQLISKDRYDYSISVPTCVFTVQVPFQNNESVKFLLNYTSELFPVPQLHARPTAFSNSEHHSNILV